MKKEVKTYLKYGISITEAKKYVSWGLTVSNFKSYKQGDLELTYSLTREKIKEIKKKLKREPIDEEITNKLLNNSNFLCCCCKDIIHNSGQGYIIHHIEEYSETQDNSYENLAVLCLHHHDLAHREGISLTNKLTKEQIRFAKRKWEDQVSKANELKAVSEKNYSDYSDEPEIILCNEDFNGEYNPVFVNETLVYREINELRKIDYKKILQDLKTGNIRHDAFLSRIKSFDEYVNFCNGDLFNKWEDNSSTIESDPQPIKYNFDISRTWESINLSSCVLQLKLINNSRKVLEDFKVRLNIENILDASAVNKQTNALDANRYSYNVLFENEFNAVFEPDQKVLVQSDFINFDKICFIPKPTAEFVILNWNILARDFSTNGKIRLKINPVIESEEKPRFVDNPSYYKPVSTIRCKFE